MSTADDPTHFKDVRIQQFRALTNIAKHGSFVDAGDAIGLARSSVWRQIRALERDTDSKLVHVNGRKVEVTPEGKLLVELVAPMIDDFETVLSEFTRRKQVVGRSLSIAAPPQCLINEIPPVIEEIQKRYPQLRIKVHCTTSGDSFQMLRDNKADIAVGGYIPSVLKDSSLQWYNVATYPMVVIMPPKHRLAGQKRLAIEDLANEPLILAPPTSSSRPLIDASFEAHGISLKENVIMEANNFAVVLPFVRAGLGLGIIGVSPLFLRGELAAIARSKTLAFANASNLFGEEKVVCVVRRHHSRTPHVDEFRRLLTFGVGDKTKPR